MEQGTKETKLLAIVSRDRNCCCVLGGELPPVGYNCLLRPHQGRSSRKQQETGNINVSGHKIIVHSQEFMCMYIYIG